MFLNGGVGLVVGMWMDDWYFLCFDVGYLWRLVDLVFLIFLCLWEVWVLVVEWGWFDGVMLGGCIVKMVYC